MSPSTASAVHPQIANGLPAAADRPPACRHGRPSLWAVYTWRDGARAVLTRAQIRAGRPCGSPGGLTCLRRSATRPAPCAVGAWSKLLPAGRGLRPPTAAAVLLRAPDAPVAAHVHACAVPGGCPAAPADLRRSRPAARGRGRHRTVDGLRVTSGAQTFLDLAASCAGRSCSSSGDTLNRTGPTLDATSLRRLARADGVRGSCGRAVRAAPAPPRPCPAGEPPALLAADQRPARPGGPAADPDRWGARSRTPTWATPMEGARSSTRDGSTPNVEQFGRDIDRYSLMAADGWLVSASRAQHLASRPAVVDARRRALLSRGWRAAAS